LATPSTSLLPATRMITTRSFAPTEACASTSMPSLPPPVKPRSRLTSSAAANTATSTMISASITWPTPVAPLAAGAEATSGAANRRGAAAAAASNGAQHTAAASSLRNSPFMAGGLPELADAFGRAHLVGEANAALLVHDHPRAMRDQGAVHIHIERI